MAKIKNEEVSAPAPAVTVEKKLVAIGGFQFSAEVAENCLVIPIAFLPDNFQVSETGYFPGEAGSKFTVKASPRDSKTIKIKFEACL